MDEIARMSKLREEIDGFKEDLTRMCEPSRELSLALTKLDEARMWGQEAIAVVAVRGHQPRYSDPTFTNGA